MEKLTNKRDIQILPCRLQGKPYNIPCGHTSCIWNTERNSYFFSRLSDRKCRTDPESVGDSHWWGLMP